MKALTREDFASFVGAVTGRRLRELRAKKGWSLRKAAREYGVSHCTVRLIESGSTTLTLPTLYAICSGLGLGLADILPPVPVAAP